MRYLKEHPFAASAVPAFFISFLTYLLCPVYYMQTDDYLLNYIANGSYGTAGSSHLVFVRIFTGMLLKCLYRVTTSVNWYAVLLIALAAAAFTAFYACIIIRTERPVLLLPAVICQLVIVPHYLTFTVSAFLAVGAGFLTIYTILSGEQQSLTGWIFGILLVFFGTDLRDDSLYPAAALVSPLALGLLIRTMKRVPAAGPVRRFFAALRTLIIRALPLLLLAVMLIGADIIDRRAYSGEEWASFRSYTNARSAVVDNPTTKYGSHVSEFQALGLSENDYNLMISWRFCERQYFTKEVLRGAAAIAADSITSDRRLRYAKSMLQGGAALLMSLPVLLFIALAVSTKGYAFITGLLLALADETLLGFLLYFRMRYVPRVAIPMTMITLLAMIIAADHRKDVSKPNLTRTAAGVCEIADDRDLAAGGSVGIGGVRRLPSAAAALLFAAAGLFYLRTSILSLQLPRTAAYEMPKKAVVDEITSHPENLYICDSGAMSAIFYNGTKVREVVTTDTFSNIVRSGSWDSYSPRYYAQLDGRVQNADNLLTALATEENVRYAGLMDDDIEQFFREHIRSDLSVSVTEFDNMQTKIYQYLEQ